MTLIRVRIVNKSKDGITLKTRDGLDQKMSWEEFYKGWDIDTKDKFFAIMKKDVEEETEKISEVVDRAVIALMGGRSKNLEFKLASAMMLGSLVDEFQKLVPDATPADFLFLVRKRYDSQMNALLNVGVGFTHENDDAYFNSRQRRQNKRNLKRLEDEKKDSTFTIGDAIRAQESNKVVK